MAKQVRPKPYGHGRIYFLANASAIAGDLRKGFTLQAVYDKHKRGFGLTYSAFAKLVHRYASDARPAASIKQHKDPHERENVSDSRAPDVGHSGNVDPALIRKLTRG